MRWSIIEQREMFLKQLWCSVAAYIGQSALDALKEIFDAYRLSAQMQTEDSARMVMLLLIHLARKSFRHKLHTKCSSICVGRGERRENGGTLAGTWSYTCSLPRQSDNVVFPSL